MAFIDGLVECEFLQYLGKTLGRDFEGRTSKGDWSRLGNTIGALTLRVNLMTEAEVNKVLEIQDVEGGYFGEVAVNAGYLTAEQVSSLLEIQQLHDQLQLGEQLVVAGDIDVPTLVRTMAEFLDR